MEFAIHNVTGKETGKKVKLDKDVFGVEPNEHSIYLDVKQYLANQRQGTNKVKGRGEVSYSTRKIKKQKGTGGARAGSIKSGVFVGGGRIFGPEPRDYGFKLNKKVKRLARRSALSVKAGSKDIRVMEDFTFDAPKTSAYVNLLNGLELSNKKTLLITSDVNLNVVLSARNFPKAKVAVAGSINTYDIMNANVLLICEGAIAKINDILK
ncbi:MAG TPA: 50S ribosomal protein L4 [Flavobacteriales bacterium]|jgi:large subunit ribosomal protein L4|nr:50S ribosomal protein L4 [Flavobacteriales bacterium]HAW18990.1 50S ribosomal protein L4 [Flavobacteriales bacterium]